MEDTDFVVYGYLRRDYSSFYYIGKGRPDRPYCKNKRTIPHPGCRSRIVILYKNITEELALENEKKLIKLIGRIGKESGGTLRNISPGGDGVSKRHSNELRTRKQLYRYERLKMKRKNWFHPLIGEVKDLTHKELSKMYPEQNLNPVYLLEVSKNKRNFYQGWRLLENEILPTRLYLPKPADWYHPEHGEVREKTCRDLVNMFKKDCLRVDGLRPVLSEKTLLYRGWSLLKNKTLHRGAREYDWYHPVHGPVFNKTCRYIQRNFGLENTSMSLLEKVARGENKFHKYWTLLENKNYIPSNCVKLEDWEHEKYGVILNMSAGSLVKTFPDQNLKENCLRLVARNPKKSHKGWFIRGHMRSKPRLNWYHREKGAFFSKTIREMMEMDDVPSYVFSHLSSGKRKTSKGWIILKKTPKAYNKVESKVVKKPMRSKTLTKTIAMSPEIHSRITEIKDRLRLRTYDDALSYLLGDFESPLDSSKTSVNP
jgi:hypothetical protein